MFTIKIHKETKSCVDTMKTVPSVPYKGRTFNGAYFIVRNQIPFHRPFMKALKGVRV